ncbi:MAG: DUF4827 family protein [Dysgonomonas sp.]
MKKLIAILLVITCIPVFFSCSKSETYADKLKKERKAIKRLINEKNIKVLDRYPENGVFAENEFYIDPRTGVYFNVVDSGNGNRPSAKEKTMVFVRYRDAQVIGEDTTMTNISDNDYIDFTIGNSYTYTSSSTTDGLSNYLFKSIGMVAPIKDYVGEDAIVKLIVPFSCGSGFQQSTFQPVYIDYVRYTFRPGEED